MPTLFVIFFVHIPVTFAEREHIGGASFTESFGESGGLWAKHKEHLNCYRHTQQCVYLSQKNTVFTARYPPGIVQIEFRNNCDGKHCCKAGMCTPYTTGQLTSKQSYGFGSFRLRALATQDISYTLDNAGYDPHHIDVSACFTLANYSGEDEDDRVKLSMCIWNNRPNVMYTGLELGKFSSTEIFSLPFDASKFTAWYQIDYHPCHVRYFVEGELIREVKSEEIKIPNALLTIHMGMFPKVYKHPESGRYTSKPSKLQDRPHVEVKMSAFKVKYEKTTIPTTIIHDEPAVVGLSLSAIGAGCILFALVMISSVAFFCRKRHFKNVDNGNYTLMCNPETKSINHC